MAPRVDLNADVIAALDSSGKRLDEIGARPSDGAKSSRSEIKNVFDALDKRGKRELDGATRTTGKTSEGASRIVSADKAGAARLGSVGTGLAGGMGGGGQMAPPMAGGGAFTGAPQSMAGQAGQMAGQFGQMAPMMAQQAAAPMMMAPQAAASIGPQFGGAPMMSGGSQYPPGTVFLSQQQMGQLAQTLSSPEARSNPMAAVREAWDGVTTPDPISVNEVAYEKQQGKLSPGEVDAAIESAMDKTGISDPAARDKWKQTLTYMAQHESGFDASAVNLTDSNAIGPTAPDGHPGQSSRGIWQTIPTTFAAHHAAGTSNNIYDAEASAGAAINYMKDRYDCDENGGGLDAFMARRSGGYVGY